MKLFSPKFNAATTLRLQWLGLGPAPKHQQACRSRTYVPAASVIGQRQLQRHFLGFTQFSTHFIRYPDITKAPG
jgi:hypothetical protein